uniref:Gag-Pol polyprotein n=1 Tax=Tanacetum cinerariifolium TaxID=118510 RepID=A0A6L2LMA2_TANCI|nr:hypothetical protein [Tanacetum cinerariifolium]
MHNNIMATGLRDHLPMLAPGRYAHWRSRFMRYIDTKPNDEAIKKCINRENEAIHMLLTGIRDEIYSTVDACKTAHEMWIAIERLQQGESLNIQDVKTNLFLEFGIFTSRDRESMETYFSRFYKMINEMPEWSRFMALVKQKEELDIVSYHKLFDILKQYQKEVNEIHAEKIARITNPLTFVVAAQQYPDPYYQALKLKDHMHLHQNNIHPPDLMTVTVVGARVTVGSQAEQVDWLEDTDEEVDEQELEARYSLWQEFRRSYLQTQDLMLSHWKRTTQTRAPQLPQTSRNTNPRMSTSTRVIQKTSVSRLKRKSTQLNDKVVQNNSQVKSKKTEVEDHHRIFSITNKTKSITAYNDNLKSKTLNFNAVCAICRKCMFNSNHDAHVSKFLNDMNARSEKPKVVPIRNRKPIRKANQSVATPPKKIVASDPTIQKSKSYYKILFEKTSKAHKW